MLHVRKKRRELEASDIQRNPRLAQLLLHHRHHQACILVGRCLHGEVEAHPIHSRITCRIEQLICLARVVIVSGDGFVVRPTLRRQHAVRRLRLPAPQVVDHRPTVQYVRNGLPHPRIFQYGIAQVEPHIR